MSATVYSSGRRMFREDFEIDSDWLLESKKKRLREKLSPSLMRFSGTISMGNMELSYDFAQKYLNYLENGGRMSEEGFYRFRY